MADNNNTGSTAKFQFYLNRQGPRGPQGSKGDTGFSPSIEVDTNTAAEYKLKVINEDGEFVTDNLRGSAVEDLGGTYMRYNRETQAMYAGPADAASNTTAGVARIASDSDIGQFSTNTIMTPAEYVDNLPVFLKSTDGSVIIEQDTEDSKTNLRVDFSGTEGEISGLDSRVTGCESAIGTIENTTIPAIQRDIDQLETDVSNKVDKVAGKGLSTNDFTDAEEDKLMHAVVDSDISDVAYTGDYNDLINKPSIPTVDNMMTVDTAQDVTGTKTFLGDSLRVGETGYYGIAATYDHTLYPTTVNGMSRAAGVILGHFNHDTSTLASQWMFEYDDDIQGYRQAQIFNDFCLVGGTNVAIIKNTTTGKYEIVAHDTVYTESNGIDINNANQISVKVDGTTVDFNSNGELEVIGGGSGGAAIDDTQASSTTTYSSNMINQQIIAATTALAGTTEDTFLAGQYQSTSLVLANNVAVTPSMADTVFDLSTYLPNDDYDYEVILTARAKTAATAEATVLVRVKSSSSWNDSTMPAVYVVGVQTPAAGASTVYGTANIVVGSDRSIVMQGTSSSTNNNGFYTLSVMGYRRAGKSESAS